MPEPQAENSQEPTRAEVDALSGPVVLEFGASWCGFCQAIQQPMAAMRTQYAEVRHIKIEDGKGRPLGRSFRIKLWPTLVFLRDGAIMRQSVRPSDQELAEGFAELLGSLKPAERKTPPA